MLGQQSNSFTNTSDFKFFLANFLPVAFLGIVSVGSNTAGALIGALLAFIITVKAPFYVLPILMFAAAFRLLGFIGGVHFGWIIVLGFLAGTFLNMLSGSRLSIQVRWIHSAFIFLVLILFFNFYYDKIHLARSLMVIALLGSLGLLINRYIAKAKQVGADRMIATLSFSLASASIAISIAAFLLFFSGVISQSRVDEVSFSIGEAEASPSNLTRLVGIAVLFSLFKLFSGSKFKFKESIVFLAAVLFGLAAMLYGGSRMPVLAVFASVSVYLLTSGMLQRKRFFKLVLGAVIVITLINIFGVFGDSLPFIGEKESSFRIERAPKFDTNVRFLLWSRYIEQADAASIFLGSGIGYVHNPHNVYFGFFSSFGLVGVGVLIYLFYGMIRTFFRYRSAVGKALLIYTIAVFSSNGDVDRLHFWIVLCVVYIYAELLKVKYGKPEI